MRSFHWIISCESLVLVGGNLFFAIIALLSFLCIHRWMHNGWMFFFIGLFNGDSAHIAVNLPELAKRLFFICCPWTDVTKSP